MFNECILCVFSVFLFVFFCCVSFFTIVSVLFAFTSIQPSRKVAIFSITSMSVSSGRVQTVNGEQLDREM